MSTVDFRASKPVFSGFPLLSLLFLDFWMSFSCVLAAPGFSTSSSATSFVSISFAAPLARKSCRRAWLACSLEPHTQEVLRSPKYEFLHGIGLGSYKM